MKTKKRAPTNPSRYDPTRTGSIRKGYSSALLRQLTQFERDVVSLLVAEDALGLERTDNTFCPTGPGGGVDPTCSPKKGTGGVRSNVQLGYADGRGGFTDVPSKQDSEKILRAHQEALDAFSAAGIDVRGKEKIKVVDSPDPNRALAYATGNGLTYHHNKFNEESLSKVYAESAAGRAAGGVPGFAFQSHKDVMVHEIGHNFHRDLSKKDHKEWERIYEKYKGDVDHLPSFYAQENSSEMWAESVVAIVGGYRFGGTDRGYGPANPEVENFVRSRLTAKGKRQTRNANNPLATTNQRWSAPSSPEKVRLFQAWVRANLAARFSSTDQKRIWQKYVEDGFRKGAGRAFTDTKGAQQYQASPTALPFYRGTEQEFLRSSFAQPVAVEKVQLLVSRNFDELDGMTADLATKLTRGLADGLVQGKNPRDIANDLRKQVGLSKGRAELIAHTEIVRAHSEGQLTALEQLGVEEIGVAVEWSTSGRGNVCPLCASLQGVVLKVSEARGILPRHPRCSCTWIPANVGEKGVKGRKDTKGEIDKAVARSRELEGGDSDWGPESVSRERPKSVLNAFCPTGKGGGVDPTCSSGKGAKAANAKVAHYEGKVAEAVTLASSLSGLPPKTFAGLKGGAKDLARAEADWDKDRTVHGEAGPWKPTRTDLNDAFESRIEALVDRHAASKFRYDRRESEDANDARADLARVEAAEVGRVAWSALRRTLAPHLTLNESQRSALVAFSEFLKASGIFNSFCATGKGGGIDPHCGKRGDGASGSSEFVASAAEREASRKLASRKIKDAPTPPPEKVAKMRAALQEAKVNPKARAGGDARGSSADRKRMAQNLFKEFGGEERGYVVCPWTGIKMHWSSDPKLNPRGYAKFEQGKIFTACQGGGYQMPNLLPESFAANRSRNDKRLRKENSSGC